MLYALDACGYPAAEEHLRWLLTAVRTAKGIAPGLYDGLAGIAWALRRLGRPDEATELMTRVRDAELPGAPGLRSGRAGVAIGLLDFATLTGETSFADRALAIGHGLAGSLRSTAGPTARGLLDGWSGIAALFLRLDQYTGDESWAGAAEAALRAELTGSTLADGMLMLEEDEHSRLLPYLGAGGVGTALVLAAHPAHETVPGFAEALAAADRNCLPRLIAAPGLFEGRAGLILHLARRGPRELLDRQLRDLSWQVLGLRGQHATPGRRGYRLSTDLETGAAGVLIAVHEAVSGPVPLPGITDFPRP